MESILVLVSIVTFDVFVVISSLVMYDIQRIFIAHAGECSDIAIISSERATCTVGSNSGASWQVSLFVNNVSLPVSNSAFSYAGIFLSSLF